MSEKRILTLHLKGKWWEQIRDGEKHNELRRCDVPQNKRSLENSDGTLREYDEVHLWIGYPPKAETHKLLIRGFGGVTKTVITHEHFGPDPVEVFDIKLTEIES